MADFVKNNIDLIKNLEEIDDVAPEYLTINPQNANLEANADIEGLELLQQDRQLKSLKQDDNAIEKFSASADFLNSMDIKLCDVSTAFFDKAEQFIVIVKDDKIKYINEYALKLLMVNEASDVLESNFLEFVDEKNWEDLAENIGEMLTGKKSLLVHLKSKKTDDEAPSVRLNALYLPDNKSFSFILYGTETKTDGSAVLFDKLTTLPNFYLFEDRMQMAINNATYRKNYNSAVATIAIFINNIGDLRVLDMENFVLKQIASRLVFNLKKTYTVARGLKCPFWILLNDITDKDHLKLEVAKVMEILAQPIRDNFTEHYVNVNVGVCAYPFVAKSAKKMMENTLRAVQMSAQKGNNNFVIFE